jgi:hypothetical protein
MRFETTFLAGSLDSNTRHQMHAQPIPDTSRAASSLFRRGPRNIDVVERRHMPLGIVALLFDPTGVHDKPHIRDRDGRLRDVRRDYYLTCTWRRDLEDPSLIIGR